jgi:ribosomal protein L37AE/L43A
MANNKYPSNIAKDTRFYVYQHKTLDTNEIFYIGKGRHYRAYSQSRNAYWKNIVDKHGYSIEIIEYFDDEDKAYDKEEELIKTLQPKANLAQGNRRAYSFTFSDEEHLKRSEIAKNNALKPNSGVKMAALLRKGQTKETCEALKRCSESAKINSAGKNNSMYGKSHWHNVNEEEALIIKQKTSSTLKETYKNNPRKYQIIKCPHCGKEGASPGLTRYHFDNCKKKLV